MVPVLDGEGFEGGVGTDRGGVGEEEGEEAKLLPLGTVVAVTIPRGRAGEAAQ